MIAPYFLSLDDPNDSFNVGLVLLLVRFSVSFSFLPSFSLALSFVLRSTTPSAAFGAALRSQRDCEAVLDFRSRLTLELEGKSLLPRPTAQSRASWRDSTPGNLSSAFAVESASAALPRINSRASSVTRERKVQIIIVQKRRWISASVENPFLYRSMGIPSRALRMCLMAFTCYFLFGRFRPV